MPSTTAREVPMILSLSGKISDQLARHPSRRRDLAELPWGFPLRADNGWSVRLSEDLIQGRCL